MIPLEFEPELAGPGEDDFPPDLLPRGAYRRTHIVTHPVIGLATWDEIKAEADRLIRERGRICRWCFDPVPKGRLTRCGKQVCEDAIWWASSWPRVRTLVLRQEPQCRLCAVRPSLEVDHIIPVWLGGSGDRNNLRGLCRGCHQQETNRLRRDRSIFKPRDVPPTNRCSRCGAGPEYCECQVERKA